MSIVIREVDSTNLVSEIELISSLIDRFSFVSMDTEFPGVIFKLSQFDPRRRLPDHYSLLKANVDCLNLIQLGITLTDADGNLPDLPSGERCVWQFNFSDFDVYRDSYAPESIDMLRSNGMDFERNRISGINSAVFADLIMGSGVVCNGDVTWVTFHCAHDFGYLVKILTRLPLPENLAGFLKLVKAFFGDNVYDVKHMIRSCKNLFGGLDTVAKTLKVDRVVGKSHQAGSDSLLTWQVFQKMNGMYFPGRSHEQHAGMLYGLESH